MPTSTPRAAGIAQRVLMGLVRGYRLVLSPWLGNVCRFEPTCSVYALQALDAHGAAAGSYLSLRRLVRCQPFCAGGCDPVPAEPPALFRSISSRRPACRAADPISPSKPEPNP